MKIKDLKDVSIDELAKEFKSMALDIRKETNGRIKPVILLATKEESVLISTGGDFIAAALTLTVIEKATKGAINPKHTKMIRQIVTEMCKELDGGKPTSDVKLSEIEAFVDELVSRIKK